MVLFIPRQMVYFQPTSRGPYCVFIQISNINNFSVTITRDMVKSMKMGKVHIDPLAGVLENPEHVHPARELLK